MNNKVVTALCFICLLTLFCDLMGVNEVEADRKKNEEATGTGWDSKERLSACAKGLGYSAVIGASVWLMKYYFQCIYRKYPWKQVARDYDLDTKYLEGEATVLLPAFCLAMNGIIIYANYKYKTVQNSWKYLKQAFK